MNEFSMKNIKKAFKNYVFNFDMKNYGIRIKYYHTFRVARLAKKIAKSLKLSKQDAYLAQVIGFLHDIGRFEQWKQFATWDDKKSFDHGDFGVELLFEKGLIKQFKVNEKFYETIKFAVKYHNKFAVDEQEIANYCKDNKQLFENIVLHCKIIKDADKLDIFNIVSRSGVVDFNDQKTATISPDVAKSFENKTLVLHAHVKTELDRTLSRICMAFDLNFTFSQQLFLKKKYTNKLLRKYKKQLSKEGYKLIASFYNRFSF